MDSFELGQICCFGGEGDVQAVNKSQSANKWAVQKWIGMGYTMLYPNTYIFLGPSIKKHDKLWIWGYPYSTPFPMYNSEVSGSENEVLQVRVESNGIHSK